MNASMLYSLTLSQLDDTELGMTSPDGDALIQNATPALHRDAIQMLLDVHEARLALGNTVLLSIAEKLKANEAALVAGTKAVKGSISALDNLTQILDTVSTLVGIVAKIVPMI